MPPVRSADSVQAAPERLRNRLLVLVGLALVPWSVQFPAGSAPTFRFLWGMVSVEPVAVSTLPAYLQYSGAPIVFDWALAAGFFALALVVTLSEGLLGRHDSRIAAGLLALTGIANLAVDWQFSIQPYRIAVPVGTVLLWYAAWRWWYAGGGLRNG